MKFVKSVTKVLHILIVSDNKPGHINQSLGLVESLKITRQTKVEVIELSYRLKFLRPLFNSFVRRSQMLANCFERSMVSYKGNVSFTPDLVISCGGYTCASNVLIAKKFGAKSIFLGTPKGFDNTYFSLVISTSSRGDSDNHLVVDVMPQRFNEDGIKSAANQFMMKNSLNAKDTYWALLIGGPTNNYKYSRVDWEILVKGLDILSEKHGIKWLVSTSRRTPIDVEEYLKLVLCSNPNIAYLVIYNRKPEKCLSAFFGLSSAVFCTEDSSSMLSEAVSNGAAVVSISAKVVGKLSSGHFGLVKKLSRQGMIRQLKFDELSEEQNPVLPATIIKPINIPETILMKLKL